MDAIVFFIGAVLVSTILMSYVTPHPDVSRKTSIGGDTDPAEILRTLLATSMCESVVLDAGQIYYMDDRTTAAESLAIELQALSFVLAITDTPGALREALARSSGMTVEQVADCPLFLTGSAAEIQDRLAKRREQTGISYVVIQGAEMEQVERFAAEVMAPLGKR
jgi:hypothetical protein